MMSARARHRPGSRGFTLMELLVVIAIVAMLTGLIVPSIAAGMRNWQMRSAAADLVSELRLARSESIRSKKVQGVRIDLDRDRADRVEAGMIAAVSGTIERVVRDQLEAFVGDGTEPVDFAGFGSEDRLAASGVHYVLFYPRGNSTGGRIVLKHRDADRTLVVTVAPVTGRVAIERGRRGQT
jgi:general secretion pathway protein H